MFGTKFVIENEMCEMVCVVCVRRGLRGLPLTRGKWSGSGMIL